ncbi:MAG TPA: DNA mismatch repair protein MutS [Saprospiraceae bacterium]|nr:DNA mismatch repair protein MutS [Saprospiraceae bacterium]
MSVKESNTGNNLTPLMKQYHQVKAKHPDAILLFRVGDFYETFGEDAIKTAKALGIILTSRNNGGNDVELAGFPYHSMDLYLPKLVQAGYRVAVCEQLEKPSKEKKIVKRGVTEVVTPGLKTGDQMLDHRQNNYLASIHFQSKGNHGIAFLDISTGEFLTGEGNILQIEKLIQSFKPSEVVLSRSFSNQFEKTFGKDFYKFTLEEWVYTTDFTREKLLSHFEVSSLKGFGIDEMEAAQTAAGAILYYLESLENKQTKHISSISRIHNEKYLWLDRFTIRNLELIEPQHNSGIPLIDVIDKTTSPMGSRLLKKWVLMPLVSPEAISRRSNMVEYFTQHIFDAEEIILQLKKIGDLERLISKVSLGKVNPREILMLGKGLTAIQHIREVLEQMDHEELLSLGKQIDLCTEIREKIQSTISEDAPNQLSKGHVVKKGVNTELDDLRYIISHSKELLINIQNEEAEKTGIERLKIGFNNVFGYYLEVTNKYKDKNPIPSDWIRKQTLSNAERYITPALKELETKILNAEEKILEHEEQIFSELVDKIMDYVIPIQRNAQILAKTDVIISFALAAKKNGYCKPNVNESLIIDIKQGRHPVIENQMPLGEQYVPNDIYLSNDDVQIMMITGPNMSGKSAILRQTALICLMAQIGSFIPATSADIGFIDKLFTRVGASDNISSGESTFMVEMNETANILNNISSRSLILLDEIGRGTSTYDGISIAWSLAEYLHGNPYAQPKTLCATHYHELNELEHKFERIKNFNVSTREVGHKVIFLRKLIAGGSKHSFGIHVAKMAGMPRALIERSEEILHQLEKKIIDDERSEKQSPQKKLKQMPAPYQLSIFETVDPLVGELKQKIQELDLNSMTPIECMLKLNELKKLMDKDGE